MNIVDPRPKKVWSWPTDFAGGRVKGYSVNRIGGWRHVELDPIHHLPN